MSIHFLKVCNKRKRRPDCYDFHTFRDGFFPIRPRSSFRENVRMFLKESAKMEDYNVQGMPIWCTFLLIDRSHVVPLYTVEESVKQSSKPYCDHCKSTGWGNHFLTIKNYHFLIPKEDLWNKRLDNNVFDLDTHLLYGKLHCNGHGHLVCINGVEGGSKHLCGREIMDLWDRICETLRTRKISVADVSKKRSMDLRLLHGVAYGHPWFARWGYSFCKGSFAVNEHNYNEALEILSSLELDRILEDFIDTEKYQELERVIRLYRDVSETSLITLKDLLMFMLILKSRVPTQKGSIILSNSASLVPSSRPSNKAPLESTSLLKSNKPGRFSDEHVRWPLRRVKFAADVIVSALKERKEKDSSHGGVCRKDLRDAARLHIGDTGLLDYVLKSLDNVVVGNQIVRRITTQGTRTVRYTIDEICDGEMLELPSQEVLSNIQWPFSSPSLVRPMNVYNDVILLYKYVLLDYPESEVVELASQRILNAKHFVKEWPFKDEEDQLLTFICRFIPSTQIGKKELPIEDIVSVPLDATVGELKQAVQQALRSTYCITSHILVMEVDQLAGVDDSEVLFGRIESGVEVSVRGSRTDFNSKFRYQGGCDIWKVRCSCGAQDYDGERMVVCGVCQMWQHTRCSGIEDGETLPPFFTCSACSVSLAFCIASEPASLVLEDCGDLLLSTPVNDHYGLAIGC
ncbi:hypothetical protein UlMin_002025 [Ulmus minor]